MQTEEILKLIYEKLDEKKAIDIRIIDISELSVMADYFVITSGSNINQVHALADFVSDELAKTGIKAKAVEGYTNGNWILMDYGDVIIHIFDKESREFYDLERIWKGGKSIDL